MKKTTIYTLWILIGLFIFNINILKSQVLISTGSGTPDASAMLEVKSTSSGLLIPRMTSAQRTSIDNGTGAPTEGLLVFDTDDEAFYIFENGDWTNLSMSAEIWSQNSSNVYLTNSTNNVGIGTSSPGSKLVIQADEGADVDDVLFEVLDESGNPIFEVTSIGARIYVIDPDEAGTATTGGFAVGEYNTMKSKGITPCFSTDPDETRVYSANATTGGFAVGEYNTMKGAGDTYMFMIPENYFIGHQAGELIQTGNYSGKYNTFFGYQTGINDTIGGSNIFIGYKSGYNNTGERITSPEVDTIGSRNVFLGNYSGYSNTTGFNNVFLGNKSAYSNTTGGNNVFLGNNAGADIINSLNNIFIGASSGYNAIGGENNVFIGVQTGQHHTSGDNNVYLGNTAGMGKPEFTGTSQRNVFLGDNAGRNIDDAIDNVFIGHNAGYGSELGITGDYNIIIGEGAGDSISSGYRNVFMGATAGHKNTVGARNIFIGDQAGFNNEDAVANVFIGVNAGYSNIGGSGYQEGDYNVFIGNSAGYSNTTGNSNTFLGVSAGYSNIDGFDNVFVGTGAGRNNIDGDYNIFIGESSGEFHKKNNHNIFIGNSAGNIDTVGSSNTYLGSQAGRYSVGNNNTHVGERSGVRSRTGSGNAFFGVGSGRENQTGSNNTYIGTYSGYNADAGSSNTFLGCQTGNSAQGSSNVFIGYYSGNSATGSSNVFIGSNSGQNETGSNLLYIENSSTSTPLIWGDFANDSVKIYSNLNVNDAYTFPTADGSANNIMTTDGGGNLSWTDLNTLITSESTTASNGLTLNGSDVQLGGNLTASTTITQDNDEVFGIVNNSTAVTGIDLQNTGDFVVFDNGSPALFVGDNGYTGIGTNAPAHKLHVVDINATTDGTDGNFIDIENSQGTTGVMAGIRFKNATLADRYKAGIFFTRTSSYGVGDMIFANNSSLNTTNVSSSDLRLIIKSNGYVGINESDPSAHLDVNGSVAMNFMNTNADYTITDTDGVYTISGYSNILPAKTITLPTAADNPGRVLIIKRTGSQNLIIAAESTDDIDGQTSITIDTQYHAYTLQSNGQTRWLIIGKVN